MDTEKLYNDYVKVLDDNFKTMKSESMLKLIMKRFDVDKDGYIKGEELAVFVDSIK